MTEMIRELLGSSINQTLTSSLARVFPKASSGREGILIHVPIGASIQVQFNDLDTIPWYNITANSGAVTYKIPVGPEKAVWVKGSGTVKMQEVSC